MQRVIGMHRDDWIEEKERSGPRTWWILCKAWGSTEYQEALRYASQLISLLNRPVYVMRHGLLHSVWTPGGSDQPSMQMYNAPYATGAPPTQKINR